MQEKTIPGQWPDNLKLIARFQAAFAKRWEPDARYNREDFHRELLELVHLIYREAQQPMVKQMAEIINRMPFSVILPPGTKLPPEVK